MLLLENNITTKKVLLNNIALRGIDLEKICSLSDGFLNVMIDSVLLCAL